MARFQKLVAVSLAAGLVFSACSKKDDKAETSTGAQNEATSGTKAPDGTSSTSSSSTTTTTAKPVDTSKDGELATQALIGSSDLPAGSWTKGSSGSSDSNSGQLLTIPSCKKLAGNVDAAAADATGKATVSYTQGAQEELNIGNDVELYKSKDTLKEVRTMTDSADFGTCFQDFFKDQMASDSTAPAFQDMKVSAFNVGLAPEDAGVDFITGISATFSSTIQGVTVNFDVRVVFMGVDRGLSTVNLMGFSAPAMGFDGDITTIDLKPTVKAAGKSLVSVMQTS